MQLAPFSGSSAEGSSRRRRLPSSQSDMPSGTPNPSQSLPSIRHLQALIPQPPSDPSGSYTYAPPTGTGYPSSSGGMDGIMNPQSHPPLSQQSSQREAEYYGGDSEQEEDLGPPKKKRRRQALSCTGKVLNSLALSGRVSLISFSSPIASNHPPVVVHVADDAHNCSSFQPTLCRMPLCDITGCRV